MIHVDRTRVTPSKRWLARAAAELEGAAAYYEAPDVSLQRGRFEFRQWRVPETKSLLDRLFRGKCAFCESRVSVVGMADIEHFRPRWRAIGLDGKVDEPAYWWLESEWSNLYLSCMYCNRNKANRFPVVEKRARRPGEEQSEVSLILDPCVDDPSRYFVFGDDGLVAALQLDPEKDVDLGLERYKGLDRAQITIDVFGLNRSALVDARREVAAQLRTEFAMALQLALMTKRLERRVLTVHEGDEYVALRRQLLAELWHAAKTELGDLTGLVPEPVSPAGTQVVDEEEKQSAFEELEKHQIRVKTSSIENPRDKLIYRHATTLARVEIQNFRNIEHLDFAFPLGSSERTGWKVLLGENGVGKSSVLQAVALTLMGERRARALRDIDKRRLLRDGARPAKGLVRIYLSADTEPLELRITPSGFSFPPGQSALRMFVVGFGAARWLPGRGSLKPESDALIRVRNLFNPFVPLTDAREWLVDLDRGQFKRAELPILTLLDRPEGDRLRRRRGRPVITPDGVRSRAISLDELSDGYQAMLALAGEISEITKDRWPKVADAEGVVLIDELGAHLHPRWKMRVVESMRNAFPRMQFLASTHDPLCLRGLADGEILVMSRDEDGELFAFDDVPSTANMRVDQLLTSHLFGLGSTMDPTTEALFNEYYGLLGKRERTRDQARRLNELKRQVGTEGVLGATLRDQAIYQVVDEYLATREPPSDDDWAAVSDETKELVFQLLETGDPQQRA